MDEIIQFIDLTLSAHWLLVIVANSMGRRRQPVDSKRSVHVAEYQLAQLIEDVGWRGFVNRWLGVDHASLALLALDVGHVSVCLEDARENLVLNVLTS